jgi:GNAT superfamily N-acetyltransferase
MQPSVAPLMKGVRRDQRYARGVKMKIVPYEKSFRDYVIALTLDAWKPVFPKTRSDVPQFVYENFWPQGWEIRQATDVGALIDSNPGEIWLAIENDSVVGFVGAAIHSEDRMGEVTIIAVSPNHQQRGIGKLLLEHAESYIKEKGMKMVMVETVGDSGHEPARKAYESRGYVLWPVARYFKEL